MHVLYNPKSNGEALHRKRGSMAKSDFSENHSKRDKGLKVKSDALAKLIMHERTGRLQTNNKLLSKYHSVTQSLLSVTQ